jgi:hypothetical protein
VVTCNYEARELGVKKLMNIRNAKEKCPQLVLVNGEDLTRYREMSYKVTGTNNMQYIFSINFYVRCLHYINPTKMNKPSSVFLIAFYFGSCPL